MQVLTRPIGCMVWFKYSDITPNKFSHERSDAVEECLLSDREVAFSSLTRLTLYLIHNDPSKKAVNYKAHDVIDEKQI